MFQKTGEPSVVLLVDDDFDFLELVARQLEDHEGGQAFQIYVAADGAEAMAQIASLRRIDALVTDLNMPGADGLAVALSFRKQFPGKPIVMTTGSSPTDERISSLLHLPQAAFLRKPFVISALIEKLCMTNMTGRTVETR
jgi:two-component system, NtrC family, response regulator HydG